MLLFSFALGAARAETARERLSRVAADYGIEVRVIDKPTRLERAGYEISAEAVPDDMLERYVPIFETEWRHYSRTVAVKTRLSAIVIGKNVRVGTQPRAAAPEFGYGLFWLDADVGSRLPDYGRHVIHHDFFHMIDQWDDAGGLIDPAWEKMNLPNVHYGTGGAAMQTGNVGALRTDLPGFIDLYATSAVEEDKAEIFSHLISSPDYMADRIRLDPVIAGKVARIKALVAAFDPTMGDKWWAKESWQITPPAK